MKDIDVSTYTELYINNFLKKVELKKNDNFNNLELKDFLKEKLYQVDKEFKEKIEEISMNIVTSLHIKLRIPNASVGKEFDTQLLFIDFQPIEKDNLIIDSLEGIEQINGLEWNKKEQKVEGIAKDAGNFTLVAKGLFTSEQGFKQKVESIITLNILPNPRSLWKNIEPDSKLLYPKSHEDYSFLESKESDKLFFASKRGRSHAHNGTFRDDDGKIITTLSGWSILAIADGAGSCSLSREGSKIAINTSVAMLTELLSSDRGVQLEKLCLEQQENASVELDEKINTLTREIMVTSSYNALKNIHEKAQEEKLSVKEFSTTLLLTAYKKTDNGHIVISFWVGDGAIALYSKKELKLLGKPDNGEFAGQTLFLSGDIFNDKDKLSQRIKINFIEDLDALILLSDGISDPFFKTEDDLKNKDSWDILWKEISPFIQKDILNDSTKNLLSWLNFWSIGNHDDRSIAFLIPKE